MTVQKDAQNDTLDTETDTKMGGECIKAKTPYALIFKRHSLGGSSIASL